MNWKKFTQWVTLFILPGSTKVNCSLGFVEGVFWRLYAIRCSCYSGILITFAGNFLNMIAQQSDWSIGTVYRGRNPLYFFCSVHRLNKRHRIWYDQLYSVMVKQLSLISLSPCQSTELCVSSDLYAAVQQTLETSSQSFPTSKAHATNSRSDCWRQC